MDEDVNVTGIVFGAIFGALFVFTCIISAIKAVRDRRRIKERIAEKRRQKLEQSAYDNFTEIDPGYNGHATPNISIEVQNVETPVRKSKQTERSPRKIKDKPSPVRLHVPLNDIQETAPPWNYIPSQKATKNIIRRNSYDMAIGRYTVLCGRYGEKLSNGATPSVNSVAYENRAFHDGS